MKKYATENKDGNSHWYEFGGIGPSFHFYHANAYPFGTYYQMLNKLSKEFNVFGLGLRPTWEGMAGPLPGIRWTTYADDLISFLDSTGKGPVIGCGHSLGAVATMLAASKRPDLFSHLILIDPVFFTTRLWLSSALTPLRLKKRIPMVAKALGRPYQWDSPKACVDFHRTKRAFSRFPEKVLDDFGAYAVAQDKDGKYRLAFPREWEAHIYATMPYVWAKLKSIRIPVLGIRGELTDTLLPGAWNKWQALRPEDTFTQLPGVGHLAPHEAPEETAAIMSKWLKPS